MKKTLLMTLVSLLVGAFAYAGGTTDRNLDETYPANSQEAMQLSQCFKIINDQYGVLLNQQAQLSTEVFDLSHGPKGVNQTAYLEKSAELTGVQAKISMMELAQETLANIKTQAGRFGRLQNYCASTGVILKQID